MNDALSPYLASFSPSVRIRPAYVTEQLPETATDIQYGDALAVDWVRSRAYETELEIAVRACVAP